jgi:hypothetical protein
MLKATRAIYKEGKLFFMDEKIAPKDGTEVIVTFFEDSEENTSSIDAINALYGRGRGENLVDRLLQSRKEDLESDERNWRNLRS